MAFNHELVEEDLIEYANMLKWFKMFMYSH